MYKETKERSVIYWDVAALFLVITVTAVIALSAIGRGVLNINTETDFIGTFQQEALRFLGGQQMEMPFHPPGYPISIALVYHLVGDWFRAALLISVAASAMAITFSYLCFRRLLNPAAGIGAISALIAAPIFLSFSIQVSSDIFFLALYSMALCALVYAMRQHSLTLWFLAGGAISLVFLSRTNGIVLLLAAAAPFMVYGRSRETAKAVAVLTLGFSVLVALWYWYATHTGSSFMPTKTYANLALTYGGSSDRITGDARIPLESAFTSTLDVLLHDPVHVATTYLRDLMGLPRNLLTNLFWMPLAIGYALCSLAWLIRIRDRAVLLILAITVSGLVLVNMKAFEVRYYMFLLPVVGASIGLVVSAISPRSPVSLRDHRIQSAALVLFALAGFGVSGNRGFGWAEDREISSQIVAIATAVSKMTPPSSILVCRKCNAAFHAGRKDMWFPQVDNVDQLRGYLEKMERVDPVYILIAKFEQNMRPSISRILLSEPLPDWLELVAEGYEGGRWRVIRYQPELVPPTSV